MKILTEYNNMNLHDRDIIRAAKKEGRAEGAHENALETAKNLHKMGLSVEKVVQATGLSLEEVEKLKSENQY